MLLSVWLIHQLLAS
ncbi:Protein of unknown function [Bacillus toyonensis]|uniref:Uncharacterized protein n=4 Tax=Bacillus cereus group TaxID=86661 RepID=A0A1C4BWI1_9BACI|nr:Protein of unknown function [Bacillus mycoides]SCC01918.1 Protein of unknown function [Bacillus mobilis]SCC07298.1 Protein of unknown function [Bacillus wiedmannii]SCC08943.1 Protein of unknown function [Bacillus cereus]SCC10448.1 Protein of unknown function [Bacillus thuringiensis]SCL88325.1 Protein of unknown function [Bacillus cytotoxicus]SCN15596.1 Protein of unknown function [Bacillus toyonensis]